MGRERGGEKFEVIIRLFEGTILSTRLVGTCKGERKWELEPEKRENGGERE